MMRSARSLRWRLLAVTLATVAAAMLVAGWSLASLFREYAQAQFEAQLLLQLDQLTAAFEPDQDGRPRLRAPLSDPRWSRPYAGLYWQIERADAGDEAGAERSEPARSRSLWDQRLTLPAPGTPAAGGAPLGYRLAGPDGQTLQALERRVRFATSQSQDASPAPSAAARPPDWRLVVAADEAELQRAIARFNGLLALFLAILGAALLAAAFAQVHLGLRPLRDLQGSIRALRSGEARRLEGDFPAEVAPLAEDLNRVLDENERMVERAHRLAGNLAHAIKTPLAVLANLTSDPHTERATLARQLAEQVGRIHEQVDWHLSHARRTGAALPGRRTAPGPVLEGLVRVMRKVHRDREGRPELAIELSPLAPGLAFAGDHRDLHEMIGNLLDNACKWAGRQVRVQAAVVDGRLVVTIDDDGPGLSAAQREQVFRRGVRADERTPGTGLGLAIAAEIAELYGGQVQLEDSPLGGLRARLSLPSGEPAPRG